MDLLSIISLSLPPVRCQEAYSEQLQAIGGTPPYTWTKISGSFPTGVSLSAGGVLSAAAGAVPNNAVGTYTFRLRVVDAAFTAVVYDYTLTAVPAAYGRVPEFLLDNRLYGLVSRFLLDTTSREKTEIHFFRGVLAALGETYVHLDRDVLCEAWGGFDLSLRDVLDALKASSDAAVKTIEGITPDGGGNFDIVPGTGVSITPQPHGLLFDVTSLGGPIDVLKSEAAVTPGGTLTLNLTTAEYLAQLWLKSSGDVWNQAGNIPDYAGKRLGNNITSVSGGRVGMAVGSDGISPVVHVVWDTTVTVEIARFDALTLDLIEEISLGPGGLSGPPLVMVTSDGKVVVAYIIAGQMYYGVLNPTNYGDLTVPAYLNPPAAIGGGPHAPNYTGKLVGAVSPVPAEAYVGCLWGAGAMTGVGYFDTVTPGVTGGYVGTFSPVGGNPGGILDIVADSTTNTGYVVEVDNLAAPGNLLLWYFSMPFAATSVGFTILWNSAPDIGAAFLSAAQMIGASVLNPGSRAINTAFLFEETAAVPTQAKLRTVYADQVEPAALWPTAPAAPVTVPRSQSCNTTAFAFLKWWGLIPGENQVVYVESTGAPADGDISRFVLSLNHNVVEADTLIFNFSEASWIIPAFTSEIPTDAQHLRLFTSLDVFGAVEPALTSENVYLEFDALTNVLTAFNDSPFTWTIAIQAVEESTVPYPPNLMVACWQLAQALQNYWNDNAYYPSASCNPPGPGGAQGTIWDENETGTILTGGVVLYPTYYTVTPGQWDLVGGTVAQGEYYAIGAAGAATDQWFVFRYASMPAPVLAAEAVIDAFVAAAPPATGIYTLATLAAAMGHPEWITNYSAAPYDRYLFFCFVNTAGTGYRLGWFSPNYIHNSQVYGPAPTGGEFNIPVTEHFSILVDSVANIPVEFTIGRYCRAASVHVNGIEYYQGPDWGFGATMNKVQYYNTSPGGYILHAGDDLAISYYV
jgi:hypothetical protein